jgi:hypothetical protein
MPHAYRYGESLVYSFSSLYAYYSVIDTCTQVSLNHRLYYTI